MKSTEPFLRVRYKTYFFHSVALINGTSMMTRSAVLVTYDFSILMAATLHIHALAIQALLGRNQPFHPFLSSVKPHPSQVNFLLFF